MPFFRHVFFFESLLFVLQQLSLSVCCCLEREMKNKKEEKCQGMKILFIKKSAIVHWMLTKNKIKRNKRNKIEGKFYECHVCVKKIYIYVYARVKRKL